MCIMAAYLLKIGLKEIKSELWNQLFYSIAVLTSWDDQELSQLKQIYTVNLIVWRIVSETNTPLTAMSK